MSVSMRRRLFEAYIRLADRFPPARLFDNLTWFNGQLIEAGPAAGARFDAGPSNAEYTIGTNEQPVQIALLEHLREGSTFYDVGANVGYFSVIAGRALRGSGRVYAFEPVAANAVWIRRNARLNGLKNVVVIEKAIADRSGDAVLLVTRYSGGAVLEAADHRAPDVERSTVVATASIDDLVFTEGMPPPSVVKIDVEGAEELVLSGMRRTLAEHRPVIIFEIDDIDQQRYEQKQKRCEEVLRGLGYALEPLDDSYTESRWIVKHTIATPTER